jgi:hypothetical protein
MSPFPPNCLPSVPHGLGIPHGNTFPADSAPATEISPAKDGGEKWIGGPLFWSHGPKGQSGLGQVPVETAQWHSAILYFPLGFTQIQFKSSLNF